MDYFNVEDSELKEFLLDSPIYESTEVIYHNENSVNEIYTNRINDYALCSGTSFSAPIVSACVAMIKSINKK